MFFAKKRFWVLFFKVAALVYFALTGLAQIPELRYDLSGNEPVEIVSPHDLAPGRFTRSTFVAVRGTPDFQRALVYHTHGLAHTFFLVEGYDNRLVVRTYDEVTEEWKDLDRLVGRLRPVEEQPFAHRMAEAYHEQFDIVIPPDAYALALYDVPKLSGWQVGALCFSALVWATLFWLFFLRKGRPSADQESAPVATPPH